MLTLHHLLILWPMSLGQLTDVPPAVEQTVEQALDQATEIEFAELRVTDAFKTVTEQTGVEMRIDPSTLSLLPYGGDTPISATIKNITLREGLGRLLAHLGMRYRVAGDGVDVVPSPALGRLGRRAVWSELETLGWLHETRWSAGQEAVQELQRRLQFQVDALNPRSDLQKALERVGAGPGDEVLTLACDSLGWAWYPCSEEIVVLSQSDDVQRQLSRRVNLHHNGRPLPEIFADLREQTGVSVTAQPGVLTALPPQTQRLTLVVENREAIEALQAVADTTGLGYRIDAEGVKFYLPDLTLSAENPVPTSSDSPYRLRVRIPSGTPGHEIDILIRESELSAEAVRLIHERIRIAGQALETELSNQALQSKN